MVTLLWCCLECAVELLYKYLAVKAILTRILQIQNPDLNFSRTIKNAWLTVLNRLSQQMCCLWTPHMTKYIYSREPCWHGHRMSNGFSIGLDSISRLTLMALIVGFVALKTSTANFPLQSWRNLARCISLILEWLLFVEDHYVPNKLFSSLVGKNSMKKLLTLYLLSPED